MYLLLPLKKLTFNTNPLTSSKAAFPLELVWELLFIIVFHFRWILHEDCSGNSGGAWLVLRPIGIHADPQIRFRHGFKQGNDFKGFRNLPYFTISKLQYSIVNQCPLIVFIKAHFFTLWFVQSKQNFVWENGQVLAALAGLNFQVQFSMPYSIRFRRFIE